MSKIWEKNRGYKLLRPYVDWCTRTSFSKLEVKGRENIPTDGAILYASNHCNTLMDALLILQADKEATGFAARADIFRQPLANKSLRWLKILPFAREKDGREAIANHMDTYDEVMETLDHGMPFCIYIEGTHRPKHSLLPFKKGIFRLGVKAARLLKKPVYIVPVGLDYEDYNKAMATATVSYGEPINVSQYLADNPEMSDHEVFTKMSVILKERISKLFVYFPDDENYDKSWNEYQEKKRQKRTWPRLIFRTIAGLCMLPFFAVFAVFALPVWLTATLLMVNMRDKTWTSTVRYGCKFLGLPIFTLIVGILAFIFLKWYFALLCLVLIWVAPSAYYYMQNFYILLLSWYREALA